MLIVKTTSPSFLRQPEYHTKCNCGALNLLTVRTQLESRPRTISNVGFVHRSQSIHHNYKHPQLITNSLSSPLEQFSCAIQDLRLSSINNSTHEIFDDTNQLDNRFNNKGILSTLVSTDESDNTNTFKENTINEEKEVNFKKLN